MRETEVVRGGIREMERERKLEKGRQVRVKEAEGRGGRRMKRIFPSHRAYLVL